MNNETLDWIATKALTDVRAGESLPEQAGYELGGLPFVDALRKRVRTDDKPHLLRLIRSSQWSERYLGTNIARPILDSEIIGLVRSLWRQEPHFHTKLAMIYLLFHAGVTSPEASEIVSHLESRKDEFLACIHKFYDGHPTGTWGGLCERLKDKHFAGARSIYLLSLALISETDQRKTRECPGIVSELAASNEEPISSLALRLQHALQRKEHKI